MVKKIKEGESNLLFFKININILEVHGAYEFYVGQDLNEFGYKAIVINLHKYSDTKQILIIKM